MTPDEKKKLAIGAAVVSVIAAVTGYFSQTDEEPPSDKQPPVWDDNAKF